VRGLFAILLFAIASGSAAGELAMPTLTGPVVDPTELLSADGRKAVEQSAQNFLDASDKWMVVIAARSLAEIDVEGLQSMSRAPWSTRRRGEAIGIIYLTSPDSPGGRLLVVDPDWRKVAGQLWIPLFPQRIAQEFGELPFDRRVRSSAAYLAKNFPNKIDFLLPETRRVDPDSLAVARILRKAFDWLFIFVIFYTFLRTAWPNRLKESDHDRQSEELRSLGKEPFRW
jgi:hypothetical protein